MTNSVTITNLYDEAERISLPKTAEYDNDSTRRAEDHTGVWITGIWTGPRTGRHIGRSYSIWEDRTHHCNVGTRYRELDEEEYLQWCQIACIEPVSKAEEI